jgi:riboflavin biosynthesis pyrimidine reductase
MPGFVVWGRAFLSVMTFRMVSSRLIPLFPSATAPVPLRGLYLDLNLHRLGTTEIPMVFANFLASLDGRIAVADERGEGSHVPHVMKSANDFRLLQELVAQTDCIVTHGGYMRALASGSLGNVLQVGRRSDSRDLAEWRLAQGLTAQPAIVIASASLSFPLPEHALAEGQACFIATGVGANPDRIAYWQDRGFQVLATGQGSGVEGRSLIRALGALGFSCIYLSTGPWMLETMLRDGQLTRLFHTTSQQLLGGTPAITMLSGGPLDACIRLKLRSLYYDSGASDSVGQFFADYDVTRFP